ncbi:MULTISPECIES: hypothetical protein [unclassified Paenibacillus]|uniref:hypothetical protein n=2 Tax=Paenibacillus TaxID=44249 RepID=UPI0009A90B05|nr:MULTISPECIES: hypothetical protein [unclassified Paenibacillus]SLK03112.1 hypothetical protein SAMN06272722_103373 [Paenibacillus sp. RU5A]SOC69207.1 hypothetical protein SAMN05880581_103373 [Paenibacillus sp. RU26A]SOC71652.1 hypothetical protein SAMN05880586_103373 [Paenibacillus sp. RU5M]
MYAMFARLYIMSNNMVQQFQNLPTVINSVFNPGNLSRIQLAGNLLQGVSEEQAKVNAAFTEGAQRVRSWISMMKSAGQAVLVPAAQEEDLKHRYMSTTGDDAQGETIFNRYRAEAFKSGQNVTDALKGALSLIPYAQNTDQVDQLRDMTKRLSMLSPDGKSMSDASSALVAAMNGDNGELANSFNIPAEALSGAGLQQTIDSSNLDGFITKLDVILQKQGYTQQAFDTMLDSPLQKWNALVNQFNGVLGQIGQAALVALTPLLDRLNEAFANGEFTVIIEWISNAFTVAANALTMLVNGILYLAAVIQQNWDIIQPILMALAIVVLALVIAQVYSLVAAWLLLNWPILLVIAAIAAVIGILNMMGMSGTQILGVIIGSFMMLGEIVRVVVATMWNLFASLGEAIVNFFIDPVYAIQKLFKDMGIFILDIFYNVVTVIEDAMERINGGLNSLIKLVNKTFGFNIGLFQESDINLGGKQIKEWKKGLESWEPTSDKDVKTFFKMDGEYNPKAFGDGQKVAEDLISGFSSTSNSDSKDKGLPGNFGKDFTPEIPKTPSIPSMPTAPAPTVVPNNNMSNINKINNIGQVDKIGDVDGTVDVTSEDLKLMRELAEMQAIQRFVSLTPTVQVTTGDINSGHDVDSIISKITDGLNSQIVSSAQGVYG